MRLRSSIFALSLIACGTAMAGPADDFPLAKGAPGDSFLCIAWRANPDRAAIDEAWEGVFKAFHESGVIEEVWDLISPATKGEEFAEARAFGERMKELGGAVDWHAALAPDGMMAMRMSFPTVNVAMATRSSAQKVDKNYTAFKAILSEFKKRGGADLALEEKKIGDADMQVLSVGNAPISLAIARSKDVLVLGLGERLVSDVLENLGGTAKKPALVGTPRFNKAFEGLAPAKDEIVFFDGANLHGSLLKMMDGIEKEMKNHARPAGDGDEEPESQRPEQWVKMGRALIDDLLVVDYAATSITTKGMRTHEDTRTVLASSAKSRGTYRLFMQSEEIGAFDRFVPREAESFEVSQGTDYAAAHAWARDFIKNTVPNGKRLIEDTLEPMAERMGFDAQRDLFSWLGGPSVTIEMKSSNPMLGSEAVMLKKVTNEEIATKKIKAALAAIGEQFSGAMGGMGGGMAPKRRGGDGEAPMITSTPTTIAGKKGFYEIRINHPMLMMMMAQFTPIWGVSDGYVWFGTSREGIERCIKTAAGEHDNIRKNKRFTDEGIVPKSGDGMVVSVSYTDETGTAEQLQQLIGALGMGLGMATQMNPALSQMPPHVSRVFKAIPSILMKLGPVAGKMNFFQSSAACETRDGDVFRERKVQNYRKPPKVEADDDDDSWGDEDKPADSGKGKSKQKPSTTDE